MQDIFLCSPCNGEFFHTKNRRSCYCTSYYPSANFILQTAALQNAERLLYYVLSALRQYLISQTIYRYRPDRLLSSGYSDRFQSISSLRAIRADRVGHLHHHRHPSRDVPNRYLSHRFSPEHLLVYRSLAIDVLSSTSPHARYTSVVPLNSPCRSTSPCWLFTLNPLLLIFSPSISPYSEVSTVLPHVTLFISMSPSCVLAAILSDVTFSRSISP